MGFTDYLILGAIALAGLAAGVIVVQLLSLLFRRKKPSLAKEGEKTDAKPEEKIAHITPSAAYCMVTFILNDGSDTDIPVTVKTGEAVIGRAPAAHRAGHKFIHWYLSGAGETAAFDLKTPVINNISLLAYYTVNKFSVTVKGGSFTAEGVMPQDGMVEFGKRVNLTPAAAPAGERFVNFTSSDIVIPYDSVMKTHYFIMPNKAVGAAAVFALAEPEPAAQPVQQPVIQPIYIQSPPTEPAPQKPEIIYVTAPAEKKTEAVYVPAPAEPERQSFFTLSRHDVLDHILKMQKDAARFPVSPRVNEKTDDKMPDFLMCGGWCFGMMYDRNEIVFNFTLRMSKDMSERYGRIYTLQNAPSVSGEQWYNLTIDRFVQSKQEVYRILEECCIYTLKESFGKKNTEKAKPEQTAKPEKPKEEQPLKLEPIKQPSKEEQAAFEAAQAAKEAAQAAKDAAQAAKDAAQAAKDERTAQEAAQAAAGAAERAEKEERAAKEQQEALMKQMAENLAQVEKNAAAAEKNYREELEKFKAKNYSDFRITRKEIAEDTRALNNINVNVVERPKSPQLPMSLKYKDRTYSMLYGTENGVIMIVRISDGYADSLAVKHPEICRARFPKGANWYTIPIDGAFKDKESVFLVLTSARDFVEAKAAEAELQAKIDAKVAEKVAAAKSRMAVKQKPDEKTPSKPNPKEQPKKKPAATTKSIRNV